MIRVRWYWYLGAELDSSTGSWALSNLITIGFRV